MYPDIVLQRGDTVRLVGASDDVNAAADLIGFSIKPSKVVEYVYLGLGVLAGIQDSHAIGNVLLTVLGPIIVYAIQAPPGGFSGAESYRLKCPGQRNTMDTVVPDDRR